MSRWKKFINIVPLSLVFAVGLVITNLMIAPPALAAGADQGSAQVLSITNNVTSSATVFNKLDPKDIDVTVTTGTDLSALKITNGKYVLTDKDYTRIENKVTILSTYLKGLTASSAKLKFDFAGGTDKTLSIAIKNESAKISAKSVSFTNKSSKDVFVTVQANGLTLQGISYDGADLPEDAYSAGVPSSSGSVKVALKASFLATLANNTTKKLEFKYSGTGTNPSIILKVSGCKLAVISSVRAVTVTTTLGVPPELPAQVTAYYADLSPKLVDVVWDAIDPSLYSEVQTFYVDGTIAGTIVKAKAIVIVSGTLDPAEAAALELVEKAEKSKTQADKDAALASVNALPASDFKTALLVRVNAIVVTPEETEFEIIDVY